MRTHAIVLAGGRGFRFGADKMRVDLQGFGMPWQIVWRRLGPLVNDMTIVGIDIPGGRHRRDSIRAGLAAVKAPRVIIAEGARFLVSVQDFKEILNAESDAVAFGCSTTNNAVMDLGDSWALVPRDLTKEVHTPQVFATDFLRELIEKFPYTPAIDEWSLAAAQNPEKCEMLPGNWRTALKLTNPDDLQIMRGILYGQ